MIAIAVNDRSVTHTLIQRATNYVLAVPGQTLVDATMYCGLYSMRDIDKVKRLSLELMKSEMIPVPGLLRAIANVELKKVTTVKTGDHLLVIGEVLRFAVNRKINELPLVSIGPYTDGYQLLRKKGVHRIAVVNKSSDP